MAKNKPAVEKELPSAVDAHKIALALISEAQHKTGSSMYDGYNIVKCMNNLKQAGWDSLNENIMMDMRPFAAAWLKMLNHYIESTIWCFVYNSNRGVLPEKKAGSLADTALAEYRLKAESCYNKL